MLSAQKPLVEKYLNPLVKYLAHTSPNTLTLLGSIPPLLFFVFIIWHWYILAVIAFIGSLTDTLDGMVARKYNKVTPFGGLLDSTMDRVSNFFVITAFAFSGIVRWEIIAPLLLFAFLTSYVRAQGGVRSKTDPANFASGIGFIEHSERMIWIIVSLLLYLLLPKIFVWGFNIAEISFIVLTVLSLYTVIQRISYAYKNL